MSETARLGPAEMEVHEAASRAPRVQENVNQAGIDRGPRYNSTDRFRGLVDRRMKHSLRAADCCLLHERVRFGERRRRPEPGEDLACALQDWDALLR